MGIPTEERDLKCRFSHNSLRPPAAARSRPRLAKGVCRRPRHYSCPGAGGAACDRAGGRAGSEVDFNPKPMRQRLRNVTLALHLTHAQRVAADAIGALSESWCVDERLCSHDGLPD